jgi:hypothetical protein
VSCDVQVDRRIQVLNVDGRHTRLVFVFDDLAAVNRRIALNQALDLARHNAQIRIVAGVGQQEHLAVARLARHGIASGQIANAPEGQQRVIGQRSTSSRFSFAGRQRISS